MSHLSPAALQNFRRIPGNEKTVNVTEHDIKLQQTTGYHHQGRHEIGYINTPKAPEERSTKR